MKKSILLLSALMMSLLVFAQAPQKMSYQTVIRNATDDLVSNSTVGIQISVLQGSAVGTAVYVETHAPTTNANGLASLEIGGGAVVTGAMAAIDWGSGPYYVKSEVDPTGGTSYTLSVISELLSVPYALHSGSSGTSQWSESGSGINTSSFTVGVNSEDPLHTLDVRSQSLADPAGLNVSNADRSRYVRLFSGSETFPDPSMSWSPEHSLLFATFDDNTLDFQEKMRISSVGDVGIGITDPEARLDILGGDWNLDAGNPGDLRIGNETYNFRVGVATGGSGAGVTRLYTNFNTLILGANDVASLVLEPDGRIIAPFLSNTLIDDGGDKSLVTKEYVDGAKKAAIKMYTLTHISDFINNEAQALVLGQTEYNFGGGSYNNATGEYTVPHSGVYDISTTLLTGFSDTPGSELILILRVLVNGAMQDQTTYQIEPMVQPNYGQSMTFSCHLSLNEDDVVSFIFLPRWFDVVPSPRFGQFSNICITKVY